MATTDLPYRPNVCMFVLSTENKVFVGERSDHRGAWQLPQGGVETGMSLEENVLKELSEELGAPKESFTILKKLSATHTYDFFNPPSYAVGVWRGQAQTFWLVRFVGKDSSINVQTHEAEFQSYTWIDLSDLEQKVEPHRFEGYKKVIPEIMAYLISLG
jgi:putative (di)nucleoside polyphosphate hydrolase